MVLIIKHISIEGPGTLEDFFRETSRDINIVELGKGEILPVLDGYEAVVSLGGPMNVYETEKYPFLLAEEDFLKEALAKGIPVLGVCLGAQLLAKANGAGVRKAKQEEIGWYAVELTEEGKRDSIFQGVENHLEVFQWHQDSFDIPRRGTLLATSPTCKNQAMRIGEYAWGLQFHLEITPEMLESWLDYYSSALDKKKLLLDCFKKKDTYQRQAKLVYLNFTRIIDASKKPLIK